MDYSRHYATFIPDEHAYRKSVAVAETYIRLIKEHGGSEPVLDVGCGWGVLLTALAEHGISAIGIDNSPEQVRRANQYVGNARHCLDSIAWLQEQKNTFGTVFLMDVLEHVPKTRQIPLCTAIHDALQPGGILIAKVPNADSPNAPRMRYIDFSHECAYTKESIGYVLSEAGFTAHQVIPDYVFINQSSFNPLKKAFWMRLIYLLLVPAMSVWHRLELMSQFGHEIAFSVPITPNLIVIAKKDEA